MSSTDKIRGIVKKLDALPLPDRIRFIAMLLENKQWDAALVLMETTTARMQVTDLARRRP